MTLSQHHEIATEWVSEADADIAAHWQGRSHGGARRAVTRTVCLASGRLPRAGPQRLLKLGQNGGRGSVRAVPSGPCGGQVDSDAAEALVAATAISGVTLAGERSVSLTLPTMPAAIRCCTALRVLVAAAADPGYE